MQRHVHHTSNLPSVGLLLALAVTLALSVGPATAQIVEVKNGATLRVAGGSTLDLRGATLDLGAMGSTARLEETGGGRVTGGLLTATRELSSPSGANVAGLGAVISADENLGATTVTRGHTVQTGGGNTSIERYYDVSPATGGGLDATLTFRYHEAELGGLPEEELELFQSTDEGATWSGRGYDSRDAANNTVTLGGIEAFSRWTLGSEASPLPVELTAFEATRDGEAVVLRWATADETNSAGFAVERARDDGSFAEIGFVEGAGTTSEPQAYRFADQALPFTAERLRYRLRQVDIDGAFTHSAEVEVRLGGPERVALHASFPNPVREHATIRYELPRSEKVRLAVYNALGRRVALLANEQQAAGRKEITFEPQGLPSGVYFVQLTADSVVRIRKMAVVR